MNDKVAAMIGNRDGKFVERFIPALISAAVAVVGMAIVFWSDTRANDRETATAIARLDKELAAVKEEAKEARLSAAADRQKTAELAGDVRNVLRSTARIEALLDRLILPPSTTSRP